MRVFLCAAVLVALFPGLADAAGLASGKNFSVLAPGKESQEETDRYTALVLSRAESFRAEFAREWLGEELPPGEGRTLISIEFSNTENSGLTLAKDHPSRRFHKVFLATTSEGATGNMLHHEVAHTVLATRYPHPNRLPPWVEEGIASRHDSKNLIAVRQQEVRSWVRTQSIPSLASLLNESNIRSFDETGYAAAESLVAYLLTLGDKQTFLRFADEGQRGGWDRSLRTHYQIDGQGQLQRDWQSWLVNSVR